MRAVIDQMELDRVKARIATYKCFFTGVFSLGIAASLLSIILAISLTFNDPHYGKYVIAASLSSGLPAIMLQVGCMMGFARESRCVIGCFIVMHLAAVAVNMALFIAAIIYAVSPMVYGQIIASSILPFALGTIAYRLYTLIELKDQLERNADDRAIQYMAVA